MAEYTKYVVQKNTLDFFFTKKVNTFLFLREEIKCINDERAKKMTKRNYEVRPTF